MKLLYAVLLLCVPVVSAAQQTPAAQARDAVVLLNEAAQDLDSAGSARDRVRALTATIIAYEEGLSALRSGLRQSTAREAELSTKLQAHDGEIAALLMALQRVGGTASPVVLLHPGGTLGTARAGMLVADLAPALDAQAADLRSDLEELNTLRALQETATQRLEDGLREVQGARAALNQALADRTDLPKRFVSDPVREAILIASANTLDSFAAGLDKVYVEEFAAAPRQLQGRKGELELPAQGVVLRAAGEADAAGIVRPGLILATRPEALVSSPVPATIRYIGPLLDFGNVVILEPQANVLFVLAGLETVFGSAGELIKAGDPLGLMGSSGAKNADALSTDGDEGGAARTETLYIEVRQDNVPQNPSLWFRTDKNG